MIKNLMNWLKNNLAKILQFLGCFIFGAIFHLLFLMTGGVEFFSVLSLFVYSLACFFLIFQKRRKKLSWILILIVFLTQFFITFYNFPECSSPAKYTCSCSGIKKHSFGSHTQCIGYIDSCFVVSSRKTGETTKVSCDGFPEKFK